jgi:hypothetical protein
MAMNFDFIQLILTNRTLDEYRAGCDRVILQATLELLARLRCHALIQQRRVDLHSGHSIILPPLLSGNFFCRLLSIIPRSSNAKL